MAKEKKAVVGTSDIPQSIGDPVDSVAVSVAESASPEELPEDKKAVIDGFTWATSGKEKILIAHDNQEDLDRLSKVYFGPDTKISYDPFFGPLSHGIRTVQAEGKAVKVCDITSSEQYRSLRG